MATFVLVHGAWHGSWCWQRVRAALQRQGHEVFTPTLSGCGERVHLLDPKIKLETHIQDVVNLIRWEELDSVVLCGHSYAGCVVSSVADRIPEQISHLVYLDAFVPESGQCLHDRLPEEQRSMQLDLCRQVGEGWKVPPIPAEVFNVNKADRAWVDRQCTMQSLATFQQPVLRSGKPYAAQRTTYVMATGWEGSPFAQFYQQAQAAGWGSITLDGGHDLMLDKPAEVVQILLAAAAH
ncbi:MAG: alpha/beta fold hydrolase [Pseudomonadota bacterium]